MIKCVIFDLDGLMVKSEELWTEMERIYLAEQGIDYRGELHYELMGLKQEEVMKKFQIHFGIKENFAIMLERRKEILINLYEKKLELREGLLDLMDKLKKTGLILSIASGSPYDIIIWVLEKFKIREFFNPVVSADFVEKGKPEPDIYLKVCDILSLSPSQCIVLEDSYNGVLSAIKAGTHCIAVPEPSDPNDFRIAHAVVQNLFEAGEKISEIVNSEF